MSQLLARPLGVVSVALAWVLKPCAQVDIIQLVMSTCAMPDSPYSAYRDFGSQMANKPKRKRLEITDDDKKRANDRGFMEFLGNIAPAAGTAIGGVVGGIAGSVIPGAGTMAGAGVGAGIGGAVGGAAGAAAKGYGASLTADKEADLAAEQQDILEEDERRQSMMNVLASLRR